MDRAVDKDGLLVGTGGFRRRSRRRVIQGLLIGSVVLVSVAANMAPAQASATTGSSSRTALADAATSCPALAGFKVPAKDIGLPSLGAVVQSATLKTVTPSTGTPEFCLVTGRVISVDPAAPPVNFEVNLPTEWNRRTLQMGGSGFDGTVVTGLDEPLGSASAPGQVPAIDLGYVTFGSDGGASVGSNPTGSFLLNATALANYSGEAVKRTRDTAITLVNEYYHRAPVLQYFEGGSKGGQEALAAAQRYGRDYNGIIAYYPVSESGVMGLSWLHNEQLAYAKPGSDLDLAKQTLFENALLTTCDKLDGAIDGVVSNVSACEKKFKINSLRCQRGLDTGDTCLSDAQIATLEGAATPYKLAFKFANGVNTVGGFPVFSGTQIGMPYWMDPDSSGMGGDSLYNYLAGPEVNYLFKQLTTPPPAVNLTFNYPEYKTRLEQVSAQFDTTNPDMDQFVKNGGKLIIVQGDADMLVPPAATDAFYRSVAARYGAKTQQSLRYYKVPGFGHGFGTFNLAWDSLAALNTWVSKGTPPQNPVDYNGSAAVQARPLCQYPTWPKYKGRGDINAATSFECVTGQEQPTTAE
jgi:hypothetical protein